MNVNVNDTEIVKLKKYGEYHLDDEDNIWDIKREIIIGKHLLDDQGNTNDCYGECLRRSSSRTHSYRRTEIGHKCALYPCKECNRCYPFEMATLKNNRCMNCDFVEFCDNYEIERKKTPYIKCDNCQTTIQNNIIRLNFCNHYICKTCFPTTKYDDLFEDIRDIDIDKIDKEIENIIYDENDSDTSTLDYDVSMDKITPNPLCPVRYCNAECVIGYDNNSNDDNDSDSTFTKRLCNWEWKPQTHKLLDEPTKVEILTLFKIWVFYPDKINVSKDILFNCIFKYLAQHWPQCVSCGKEFSYLHKITNQCLYCYEIATDLEDFLAT